jgi:tight adherence protein C
MQIILIGIIGSALGVIGLVFLILSLRWVQMDDVTERLKEYVTDTTVEQHRWRGRGPVAPRELTGSLVARLILPVVRGVGRFLGRMTPSGAIDNINHKLMVAGNPSNLGAREFYGINIAMAFVGFWLAFIFLRSSFSLQGILVAAAIVLLFYMFPQIWLRGKIRQRQNTIRKNLPDALDMLSVCASAGLGFDQALQRVSEYWDTPLSAEFTRMLSEMEMGISRRDAMRNLSDRNDVPEISSFVALILQADQLGMSISETLQAIAEQMRIERRFRAQEMAQKAPTKMLIPLAFLIFPALLAIILGPSIPVLVDVFRQF